LPQSWFGRQIKLDEAQQIVFNQHPIYGQILLRTLSDIGPEAQQAMAHQLERWDGAGHPHHLRGESISLPGRMLAVSAAFADLCADPTLDETMAAQRLAAQAGGALDPQLVDLFCTKCLGPGGARVKDTVSR
jgi:HD-GYP domain-containing protein (c-di-GMP phosphodiesterase class II)